MTLIVLVTQRREGLPADRRGQMTLEPALLADKRSAKIIELLEKLRRDEPSLADRADPEPEDMAKPTDPVAATASTDAKSIGGRES